MRSVGARELKTRLGTYLREVREGAVLVVTERGRPVAELRPIQAAESEEELQLLANTDLVSPRTAARPQPREPVEIEGEQLSQTIVEQREDRL
jgi:prevent-host-death family protein